MAIDGQRPLISSRADQLEDKQEDVDNVDVEHNRGHDVLFRTDGVFLAASDQLRVVGQELVVRDRVSDRES